MKLYHAFYTFAAASLFACLCLAHADMGILALICLGFSLVSVSTGRDIQDHY